MAKDKSFNPLCFVLKVARIIGVFPVELASDYTFKINKRYRIWSALILTIYYLIELWKFRARVNAENVFANLDSYDFLLIIVLAFSNINTFLNFVFVFSVLHKLIPLLNIMLTIYCKLNVRLKTRFKLELMVLVVFLPSLANLAHLFYSFAFSTSDPSIAVNFFLFTCKSMSYTCISWLFCSICCVVRLLMSEINAKISEKKRLDEMRAFFSSLCHMCHRLNHLSGGFSLFYLVLVNMHLQIDFFIVLKNAYNIIVGVKAEMWGYWGLWSRLSWTVFSLFKVFAYAWSITRLTIESNKTGVLLAQVSNSADCNSLLKEQVYWFAEEVKWNKISFTANGLFTIDRQLLFTVAGSCATNMAILLQTHIVTINKQN